MGRVKAQREKTRSKKGRQRKPRFVDRAMEDITSLQSTPLDNLLSSRPLTWLLPISSISEQKVIELIEEEEELDDERLRTRTQQWLARAYPKGVRVGSDNMDPLPAWGVGLQLVALNYQTNDLPVQINRALFSLNGGLGYVLKPEGLRISPPIWPPQRTTVRHVKLKLVSLHQLPTRKEVRPDLAESAHHQPEALHSIANAKERREAAEVKRNLSGEAEPPQATGGVVSPSLSVSLHAIGGYAGVSTKLPPKKRPSTKYSTPAIPSNGLTAFFGTTVHCFAAEPRQTILHIAVDDTASPSKGGSAQAAMAGMGHAAYEAVVLDTLRPGYRCLPLRSNLGTRIEMCSLLLHIQIDDAPNPVATPSANSHRELLESSRCLLDEKEARIASLSAKVAEQKTALDEQSVTIARLDKALHTQVGVVAAARATAGGLWKAPWAQKVDGSPQLVKQLSGGGNALARQLSGGLRNVLGGGGGANTSAADAAGLLDGSGAMGGGASGGRVSGGGEVSGGEASGAGGQKQSGAAPALPAAASEDGAASDSSNAARRSSDDSTPEDALYSWKV